MFRLLIIVLLFASLGHAQFPGPDVVTGTKWTALPSKGATDAVEYNIRDLGNAARPKIVYNCAKVPALCNNAIIWLQRWNLGITGVKRFHFDADLYGSRNDGRREFICLTTWINNGRCPETGAYPSPNWLSAKYQQVSQPPTVYQVGSAPDPVTEVVTWTPDKSRLARRTESNDPNDPTGVKKIITYTKEGVIMSCDEFPPASWIEGGVGTRRANEYCAPMGKACYGALFDQSEQNWQEFTLAQVRNWVGRFVPENLVEADWTIYSLDFEMITDASAASYAVWLEASGNKRYCFGPQYSSRAAEPGCKPDWPTDSDVIVYD